MRKKCLVPVNRETPFLFSKKIIFSLNLQKNIFLLP